MSDPVFINKIRVSIDQPTTRQQRRRYWNDLPHGPAWIRRRDLAELIGEGQAVAADLEIEPKGGHA